MNTLVIVEKFQMKLKFFEMKCFWEECEIVLFMILIVSCLCFHRNVRLVSFSVLG